MCEACNERIEKQTAYEITFSRPEHTESSIGYGNDELHLAFLSGVSSIINIVLDSPVGYFLSETLTELLDKIGSVETTVTVKPVVSDVEDFLQGLSED